MNILKALFVLPHHIIFSIIGLFGIGFLIGIHELGHFLFAKLFHVRTPSFSIGFGPQLISKKIGQTTFSLSAIPLGGYVEIAGMEEIGQGEQVHAKSIDETSFAVKPFYQKMCILFGGILFNLLFAYFSISLIFMLGAPKSDLLYPLRIAKLKPVITMIAPDSPAKKAGLEPGDEILAIHNQSIDGDIDKLETIVQGLPGQTVPVLIKRNDLEQELEVPLKAIKIVQEGKEKEIGELGPVMYEIASMPRFGFFGAIKQGFKATNTYIFLVLRVFKRMFVKRDITGVGGPLMVITETIGGAQKGFKIFILLLAIISINLAILNLIPIPILDGGQVVFVTIEAMFGTQLPKLREYIHIVSWVLVLALIIYLTIKDIGILKWFGLSK